MTFLLPPDLQMLDRIALAVFLVTWLGYGPLIHTLGSTSNITSRMLGIRRAWMHSMLGRDNRITDSSLLSTTVSSSTFFASTTLIAIAALLGMLGKIDLTFDALQDLAFTVKTSKTFVEFKILLLCMVFGHSFLKLSWALRQLNYCLALVGGAPLKPSPAMREAMADGNARVLSLAISSFNAGIRGYYFAIAALCWLLGPAVLLAVTLGVLAMLLWRQFASATADAIRHSHRLYAGRDEPVRGAMSPATAP